MDDNKKISYSESADYFPEEIRKKHKFCEYSEDRLEDCGGIEPIPLINHPETKSVSG
ncbi:MAG: hypothetical protein IJZ07_01625 [Clostridia bacterium]|nr:hypothetical protein [Clostridia bacterium]